MWAALRLLYLILYLLLLRISLSLASVFHIVDHRYPSSIIVTHQESVSVYLSLKTGKHICLRPPPLPSLVVNGTSRLHVVSVYVESLSHTDTHTPSTPRGENQCLRVIQQPPQLVLALTRGACHPPAGVKLHCLSGTRSALPPLGCFGCWLSLVPAASHARHALWHNKEECEYAYKYSYKQDELCLTVSSPNRLILKLKHMHLVVAEICYSWTPDNHL